MNGTRAAGRMLHGFGVASLALALALWAPPAAAQCGMMGGHDHGKGAESHEDRGKPAAKPSRNQKKLEQSAQKLLAEDEGRRVLLQAALADPGFMRMLIGAMAEVPEWRDLAARQLAGEPLEPPAKSPNPDVLYTCPMHPEVKSIATGTCPKCGMALERAERESD